MLGFGRRGKIKRAADKFVEAMVEETENSYKEFVQLILQLLMDEDVEAERSAEVINAAPPDLVLLSALFSFELIKVKYKFDEELARDIGSESIRALKQRLQEPTGEAMKTTVSSILENIQYQDDRLALGEERSLELVGWNAIKFFNFDANPEIRQLMDNSTCMGKLKKFLDDKSSSWWRAAEKIGAF
ncbi:MAG: hypothetical protein ISR48_02595 [Alphaproteobacteria bacterium]|nr:hypothetical protein [Alphaproteobacteria bacterium]